MAKVCVAKELLKCGAQTTAATPHKAAPTGLSTIRGAESRTSPRTASGRRETEQHVPVLALRPARFKRERHCSTSARCSPACFPHPKCLRRLLIGTSALAPAPGQLRGPSSIQLVQTRARFCMTFLPTQKGWEGKWISQRQARTWAWRAWVAATRVMRNRRRRNESKPISER